MSSFSSDCSTEDNPRIWDDDLGVVHQILRAKEASKETRTCLSCSRGRSMQRCRRPSCGAAQHDGVSLATARRRKERTYPELVGPLSRVRLVVLAGEVWRPLVRRDFEFLAFAGSSQGKARTPILRKRAECAWRPDGQRS